MEEIKKILDKLLIRNDVNISKIIMEYAYGKCFICWQKKLDKNLHKSYCDVKTYPKPYMDVCNKCVVRFDFKRCIKCGIYLDKSKCYVMDNNIYVCSYCCGCGWTWYNDKIPLDEEYTKMS